MKIALAGNPNCGKTTMFNILTGSSQYVGNWPGVTVEKKEGKLKGYKDVTIIDLPGIYSLSPYSLEEVVSRNYLMDERPDLIINIIDASNLERNLYLTTQLLETGLPVLIALNMMDIVKERKDIIRTDKLSSELGCQVFEVSALKNSGLSVMCEAAVEMVLNKEKNKDVPILSNRLMEALKQCELLLDTVFDDETRPWYAIKILEHDEEIMKRVTLHNSIILKVKGIRDQLEMQEDDDIASILTNARYEFIDGIMKDTYKKANHSNLSVSDKIDRYVTNRWLALPIFVIVMWLVYYLAMQTIGAIGADWVNDVLFGEWLPNVIGNLLTSLHTASWLNSLILDGIISGVGAVLGFVPQIMVLFFLLSILEDCGYMARVAFIMDRIFRKFGLSGKSFIPMLIATGCGVPAIMASRTIENEKDRKMTIMLTTFIPCSAKLPIFALFAGAIFNAASWVSTSMYFIGLFSVIICGVFLKKTKYFSGDPAPFVMELPSYHLPSLKGLFIHMWDRAKAFIKKAGTIILLATIFVWFTKSFNWKFEMVEESESILASIGTLIAPIFTPLGWGDWRAAVASFTGLIAKENIVGTFGVLYGMGEVAEDGVEVWKNISTLFTPLSAYSFMVFNLLCAPCFAAIGTVKREMGSAKWTWITVAFQCGFAYLIALLIFQIGRLFI